MTVDGKVIWRRIWRGAAFLVGLAVLPMAGCFVLGDGEAWSLKFMSLVKLLFFVAYLAAYFGTAVLSGRLFYDVCGIKRGLYAAGLFVWLFVAVFGAVFLVVFLAV